MSLTKEFINKISKFTRNINTTKHQSFFINLTYKCPLRCNYCYINRNDEDMTFEQASYIVKELTKSNYNYARLITFFGGEPTLKIDIIDKVLSLYYNQIDKRSGEKKTRYGIITSFSYNPDHVMKLCDKYNDLEMVISYDNPQNKQRVYSNGDIVDLTKIIRKYDLSSYQKNLCIMKTCNGREIDIYKDLKELDDFYETYGIMYTWNHNKTPFGDIDIKKFIDGYSNFLLYLFKKIINNLDIYIPKIVCSEYEAYINKGKNSGGCGLTQEIFFSAKGEIYPCAIPNRNISDWEMTNDGVYETLETIESNLLNNKYCHDCYINHFCSGGCPADRLINNGDTKNPNKLWCEYSKGIYESYKLSLNKLNDVEIKVLNMKLVEYRIKHYRLCSTSDIIGTIVRK